MIFYLERRFFEAVDGVTALAFASVRPLCKLAVVRIGRMAVGTKSMCQMALEIPGAMASIAPQLNVLAEQRILCLRMIESGREACLLPGNGVVTGFAALLERSFVNVGVTGRTLVELQADEFRRFSGNRRVTLFAFHSFMCACQLESGLRVVEFASTLPVHRVVTADAIAPQLAVVLVFVARRTGRRHSEK